MSAIYEWAQGLKLPTYCPSLYYIVTVRLKMLHLGILYGASLSVKGLVLHDFDLSFSHYYMVCHKILTILHKITYMLNISVILIHALQ